MLLVAAALALLLANSTVAPRMAAFWQGEVGFLGGVWLGVRVSPAWLVADVLMPVFFFAVGLEIRAELTHGVLSTWRRAALPLVAALGGMLVPALLYLGITHAFGYGSELSGGWGVPIATDIAFALGVLALLGKRVPNSLRVLLLALAVLDDLGAIVVIALFYSKSVALSWLGLGALGLLLVYALERWQPRGLHAAVGYGLGALFAWLGCYVAGVHPSIAGAALGLLVRGPLGGTGQGRTQRLRKALKPWVELVIMPVFALANAGVALAAVPVTAESGALGLGIGVGLVLGKPLGVVGASLLSIKLGVARLPAGVGKSALAVLGAVAGIGFTMALFVAELAFDDVELLRTAKLGIAAASGIAASLALLLGGVLLPRSRAD